MRCGARGAPCGGVVLGGSEREVKVARLGSLGVLVVLGLGCRERLREAARAARDRVHSMTAPEGASTQAETQAEVSAAEPEGRHTRPDTGPPIVAPPPVTTDRGPNLGGCAIFPPDNAWNREVTALAVSPRSAATIANIQAHGDPHLHADFGDNPEWGLPFVVVPPTQGAVPVRYDEYGDESDPGPFPIPLDAPIEFGNDHHVLVLQQGTCRLFELYHARRERNGWVAGSGATFDLSSNRTRHEEWTSCDQAGLPILPGLVRFDEVSAGVIRHAIRVTFEHTQGAWIAPATHPGTDDNDPDAPPMGLRLRMRADYDTRRIYGQARVIVEAMKRYGLLVADTGGNWYLSGATDRRWNNDDLDQLKNIPGTAFEVVDTGPLRRRRR